jgi:hypothetical protein
VLGVTIQLAGHLAFVCVMLAGAVALVAAHASPPSHRRDGTSSSTSRKTMDRLPPCCRSSWNTQNRELPARAHDPRQLRHHVIDRLEHLQAHCRHRHNDGRRPRRKSIRGGTHDRRTSCEFGDGEFLGRAVDADPILNACSNGPAPRSDVEDECSGVHRGHSHSYESVSADRARRRIRSVIPAWSRWNDSM